MIERRPENIVAPSSQKSEPAKVTVSIVEDDEAARNALTFWLAAAGFDVSAYSTAESFLATERFKENECVVADIFLPRMNGLQLYAEIKRSTSFAQMVFLADGGDISFVVQAMREGAVDCLEKPIDDERLIEAVSRAAQLSRRHKADNSRRIELRRREMSLTPREREVFALITAGLLNKQVGATLGATERTIKTHRGRVMDKMNADSLAALVRMADLLQVQSSPTGSYFPIDKSAQGLAQSAA
jgi:two-component system response regulator FixJ